jgi:hypothetical protein
LRERRDTKKGSHEEKDVQLYIEEVKNRSEQYEEKGIMRRSKWRKRRGL